MDQDTQSQISGVASAVTMIHAMLITELDKRGAISKKGFATLLRDSATSAEKQAPQEMRDRHPLRLDLVLARRLADHLDDPNKGWTPVVIEGDKE